MPFPSRGDNWLEDTVCNGQETFLLNALHWFVEVSFSCWYDLRSELVLRVDNRYGEGLSSRAMDYFEVMTLKVEDRVPKHENLDNASSEETETAFFGTCSCSRKGQARGGRQ